MSQAVSLQNLLGLAIFAACMAAIFVPLYLAVFSRDRIIPERLELASVEFYAPPELVTSIDAAAQHAGVSRSEFLVAAAREKLQTKGSDDA